MAFDPQKKEAILKARAEEKKQKARETIKQNNIGRNKGQAAAAIRDAKDLAKNITPWGLFSLLGQFNIFLDWMYAAALLAAILKDVLDFAEVTGVGYALVIVVTFMCSIFIAMMMLLGDSMGGTKERGNQKSIRSWLTLLSGTTVELIFGLDLLPIETMTVVIIYLFVLVARKQAAEGKRLAQKEERLAQAY